MKKKVLFIGLFLALAAALSVSAAGATDTPAAQPTVKLWAFYDKDVNAYPTGWTYLDPVITDPAAWQQDSPWLSFPSPHYQLYSGTWGSDTMGALIQEGDFGPGPAEIPLADGLYWVVLSAPPGNWQLTTDAVQKVYVWNGNVYVQWANEGLWYGDKVLVGIIDGGCPTTLSVYPFSLYPGDLETITGSGYTPYGPVRIWIVYDPYGETVASWVQPADEYGVVFNADNIPKDAYIGTFTIYAQDLTAGCVAVAHEEVVERF